ncbi:hypothetical protein JCGZ_23700 [Jatropha curcas]|uniref:RING-CH-type domain-containing protein n=2 Tax=Jatropha curcas TaxID=180498 RepID=A0A067LE44_JATCU|nr:hypothetical protein JCGZ_23700 [Jatropha curcas]
MSAPEMSNVDLQSGSHRRCIAGSDGTSFSDAEDDGSCYSQFYSTTDGSYNDYGFACVSDPEITDGLLLDSKRLSSVSDYSVEVEIENGNGVVEIKVHLAKVERDCRICHLGLEGNTHESGVPIELGCLCKYDLAAAHKPCAKAWFKIKGNK